MLLGFVFGELFRLFKSTYPLSTAESCNTNKIYSEPWCLFSIVYKKALIHDSSCIPKFWRKMKNLRNNIQIKLEIVFLRKV